MTPINTEEARRHMELLGRELEQTIWQTWPDKKTKKGFPSVSTDRNKLLSGVKGGGNAGFALAHFPGKTLNGTAKRDVDFIRNKGGVYDVLAAEWDDGSSLEEQRDRIREAQLPDPSVSVFTGGKSHHHYWLLDGPISMDEFCDYQARLAQVLGSDDAITTGDQVLRVAGFPHSETGELAEIVFPTEGIEADRYSIEEFSDLPELVVEKAPDLTGVVTAPVTDLSDAIRRYLFPVVEQFSDYGTWLKTGMAFHSLGDEYLPVWIEFCSQMEEFNETECLDKWSSFRRREDGVGAGSLYFWLAKQGWRGGEALKEDNPIETRIELLQEGLREVARTVNSHWKRRAHADDLNDALGKPVKANDLYAALAEAITSVREERSTVRRRCENSAQWFEESNQALIVDWLVYGLIAKGDSHLIVAPAKEGKSSTLAALLIANLMTTLSSNEDRIGSVLWFSDDQARTKTQGYLTAAAKGLGVNNWKALLADLVDSKRLIVDDRFNMTPDGVEELIEEVRLANRPVIVVDSLVSVCRKLGMKENDSSFANVLYDLTESVKQANPEATLVMIHHATKGGTRDKGGLESIRGTGAIPGAVDNNIIVQKPLKTSRGGNNSVSDDDTSQRDIQVIGRVPGGMHYIDLEFTDITVPHPTKPGKTIQKLDKIKLTRKAESTHQEASQASLGSFQDQVLDHLREWKDQAWTTKMLAADLGKDPSQVSRALKKLKELGKIVSSPGEGREVLYQAT